MTSAAYGYTFSYRAKWEHPIFRNKQEAAVWAWMCDIAQWMDEKIVTKFGAIDLHRGELIMAERTIAEDFGMTRDTVRRLIERMTTDGMIRLVRGRCPTRAGTIVKIVKYDDYQTIGRHISQPQTVPQTIPQNENLPTANPAPKDEEYQVLVSEIEEAANRKTDTRPTANQTANQTKNNTYNTLNTKEVRKREVGFSADQGAALNGEVLPPSAPASPKGTGSRLSPDWVLPPEWAAWALEEGLPREQVHREGEKFRDYWVSRAGQAARKADWLATWRNWVRKATENQKGASYGKRGHNSVEDRNGFAVLNRRLEERACGSAGSQSGLW